MDFGYVALSGVLWELFDDGMNGTAPDRFTDAVVRAIKATQTPDGYWASNEGRRPPMNAGEHQAAALAIFALAKYGRPSERESTERAIQKALKGHRDPWEKATAGLRAFLAVVQEPRYRRIVIQEGPSVLGYERFREQEERSTFANVLEIVRSVLAAGAWELDESLQQTFARIFFGAMSSAGQAVSGAEDPEAAAANVETAIGFILEGFRLLAEGGAEVTPGDLTSGT